MAASSGSAAARRLQAVEAPIGRVSILDLTVDQLEAAEKLVGLPASRWDDAPSQGALFKAVYSIAYGVSQEEAGALTLRQLRAAVDLSGEESDPSEPAPQSA